MPDAAGAGRRQRPAAARSEGAAGARRRHGLPARPCGDPVRTDVARAVPRPRRRSDLGARAQDRSPTSGLGSTTGEPDQVEVKLRGADRSTPRGLAGRCATGDVRLSSRWPRGRRVADRRPARRADRPAATGSRTSSRQVSLYFFDPSAPDPGARAGLRPAGDQLAATLVRRCSPGRRPALERRGPTFLPPGLDSRPVRSRSTRRRRRRQPARRRLAAQPETTEKMMSRSSPGPCARTAITTLRSPSATERDRCPAARRSSPSTSAGVRRLTGVQASPLLYGLRDGLLVPATVDRASTRSSGPFGTERLGIGRVAVSLDGDRAAGGRRGGTALSLALGHRRRRARSTVLEGGHRPAPPAWDFADRLWVVDRTADGAAVA